MARVTKTGPLGIELICHYESLQLSAYLCPAGVWTIGYGTTRYPNGEKVKKGDKLTGGREQAIQLLQGDLKRVEKAVDDMTRDDVTQNQFDALVSFAYNLGENALRSSDFLKLVNAGETDSQKILTKLLNWDNMHVNGKLIKDVPGLSRRRKSEAWLYSRGEINFFQ